MFLVGFMGAGKTSVGRTLAQRLNWIFEDLDDHIERREGRTVAEIFRDSGEPSFRRAEHAALRQVLDELPGDIARIIALGGGAFAQSRNAALLREAGVQIVFLDAAVAELWQRCRSQAGGAERPLLQDLDQFGELYKSRARHYAKATIRIETGGQALEAIADEIIQALNLKETPVRTEQGESE